MKYTCPNCGKRMDYSIEQLIQAQYKVTCPQCSSALTIVGDYAYMPLDDGTLNLADDSNVSNEESKPKGDPLYQQAVAFVGECNAITPVMLAVRFDISMERAQELMQQLESNGIVGPYNGGAPRTILIPHNTNLPYGLPAVPSPDDANKPSNEETPKFKSFSLNCSLPGCLFFLLILISIIVYFAR